jgi:hypothetical protein
MSWDAIGALAELLGALGVIATLGYLAVQIRGNTRALGAQTRHSMSDFAREVSEFRAQHADRWAKIMASDDLTPGDQEFLFWVHMQMLLFGETYHYQHQLGFMPESHWRGFARFLTEYTQTKGFEEFWAEVSTSFSEDFAAWVDKELLSKSAPENAS